MGIIYRCPKCGYYDTKSMRCPNQCGYQGWLKPERRFKETVKDMENAWIEAEERTRTEFDDNY